MASADGLDPLRERAATSLAPAPLAPAPLEPVSVGQVSSQVSSPSARRSPTRGVSLLEPLLVGSSSSGGGGGLGNRRAAAGNELAFRASASQGGAARWARKRTPCTDKEFYGRYPLHGTVLFGYIEKAALADDSRDLDKILEGLDSYQQITLEAWEATYEAFRSEISINAAHLAASLGSIHVLEWLRDHITSCNILDHPSTLWNMNWAHSVPHYTPLMSALFMSKTSTAIWLLDQGASATMANNDGMMPCHIVASFGLPNELAENRAGALAKLTAKLVEKSADLDALSGRMQERTDEAAANLRLSTALQIAARMNSAYPKQMLHLLTKSYHCPAQSQLFEEVNMIAAANPTAAAVLLEKMQERSIGDVKKRLFDEVFQQVQEGKHMDKFVHILKMSPLAGFRLLELLMIEPQLNDPQRYPLPLYTVLPNGRMLCTYQPAGETGKPIWSGKGTPPSWHAEFKRKLPSDPLLHTDVYEVNVRVLHLPGVVNQRVLSILSMLSQDSPHLSIMGGVSVNGIITYAWRRCAAPFFCVLTWELLLLLVFLVFGMYPPPADYSLTYGILYTMVWGNLVSAVVRVALGIARCRKTAVLPRLTWLCSFAKGDIVRALSLVGFLMYARVPMLSGLDRVCTTINVLIRCIGLMSLCRAVPIMGPLIFAVVRSFVPMQGMFFLMTIGFATFAFAFIIFKDNDRSVVFVLLYLYQALFLSDGDASEAISGVDLAHEQTLDIGIELFTGGGDESILILSVVVTMLASSLFSLVLLNLMIGMYTKFYEQMESRAVLMFHQHRAKRCVAFMLRPGWLLALRVRRDARIPQAWARRYLLLAGGVSLSLALLLVLARASNLLSGCFMFGTFVLVEAGLVYNVADISERNHYLWISYRTDFEIGGEDCGDTQQEMRLFRRQFEEHLAAQKKELAETKKLMKDLLAKAPGSS